MSFKQGPLLFSELSSVLSYLEMYFSMIGPDMGFIIMSMGSAVLSQ